MTRTAIDGFLDLDELDQREADIALLRELVHQPVADPGGEYDGAKDGITESELDAFEDMLAGLLGVGIRRRENLTSKQRDWAHATAKRLGVTALRAKQVEMFPSLVDNAKVPRGRDVPTPPVLQNLPKAPPLRRKRSEA